MVGAATWSWVDWGRPFIQRGMLSFVRNVAVGAVLSQTLSTRFQSEGRLSEAVRVWTLARGTRAGHLWGLKQRAGVMHALKAYRLSSRQCCLFLTQGTRAPASHISSTA